MNGFKILLYMLFILFYLYSLRMWFITTEPTKEKCLNTNANAGIAPELIKPNEPPPKVVKQKKIPLFKKHACSALEIFTENPQQMGKRPQFNDVDIVNDTIELLGISIFLIMLVVTAFLDVLKVKEEEERAKSQLDPGVERRQSLAEFANKKMLRRESSKFNLQLYQIAESPASVNEEKKSPRETRPYMRAESINSYLGEMIQSKNSTPDEQNNANAQSVSRLIGARPSPMVRRSSFPALPFNPNIQALMTNSRQSSFDSDDESEKKHRRVRILRRF